MEPVGAHQVFGFGSVISSHEEAAVGIGGRSWHMKIVHKTC